MATGDVTLFDEFKREIGEEVHNFASDTLKMGIITNTTAPTAADATPRWADYSGNQVTTGTSYVSGGPALTHTWSEAAGTVTLAIQSFTLAQDSGSGFTNGAWGVIYNDTAPADQAIGFVELGTADLSAGPVTIRFNNAAVGVAGNFFTNT
ncbi:MAG: hypothetical protein JAY60_18540 [Candidatus Thiodiazotropha weberae]|nr:hypothetical protein [Candidatus Thiodiazotropha weberae]